MRRTLAMAAAGVLLCASLLIAQQNMRTRTTDIGGKQMEIDLKKNTVVFSGDVKLTIGGGYDATMTAPKMSFQVDRKANRIKGLVAAGPVNMTVVTEADDEGMRWKITASATKEANYSEETQIVKLTGGAKADMVPVGGEAVDAYHFTGDTITANLKTSVVSAANANLSVKTELRE